MKLSHGQKNIKKSKSFQSSSDFWYTNQLVIILKLNQDLADLWLFFKIFPFFYFSIFLKDLWLFKKSACEPWIKLSIHLHLSRLRRFACMIQFRKLKNRKVKLIVLWRNVRAQVLVFLDGMKPATHSHSLVSVCHVPSDLHKEIGLLKLDAGTVAFWEHLPVTFFTELISCPGIVRGKWVKNVVVAEHTS